MVGRMTRAAICLCVCVFVTNIRGLRPGQPLQGAGRGAQVGLARPSCPVHPHVSLLVPRPVWPAHRALCTPVCLSWFKETEGLHSVRRSRVPTSSFNTFPQP
jgi:hypothetical protein